MALRPRAPQSTAPRPTSSPTCVRRWDWTQTQSPWASPCRLGGVWNLHPVARRRLHGRHRRPRYLLQCRWSQSAQRARASLGQCTCEIDWSTPLNFGLTGFAARGGAPIAGSQVVADQQGELAICYMVQLADGTTLRATCPEAGPTPSTTAPPLGSIYLGCDAAATRVWATTDGRIISTSAKSRADAALVPPLPPPPVPNRWCNRYTALAFITHLLVLCVAVGWSAGRPSAGMGHIVGLPDAPHDAGTLARKALDLFTLPSTLRLAASLVYTVVGYFGYIIAITLYLLRLLATLLYATLTCVPAQRCASCQSCIIMLAAATLRSTICTIWAYGPGPVLAALGHLVGGAMSATSCVMTVCATGLASHAALVAAPHAMRTLICRLRRARGRVSPLIPPGSPPPWDTSTIYTRRRDFIHRSNWESRFAGTRRTCYNHLVSATRNWHLPWWLLALALQWMVVVCLDLGAQLLNYRVAVRSYRDTLPLLGDDTPTIASAIAMGRWMARWLRRSHDGARRHISHRLRTLAHALLVLYTLLLYNLLTHGISGITHGALDHLVAWLVTILLPLPRLTSDFLCAAHSISWLHWQNAAHRVSTRMDPSARHLHLAFIRMQAGAHSTCIGVATLDGTACATHHAITTCRTLMPSSQRRRRRRRRLRSYRRHRVTITVTASRLAAITPLDITIST